MQKINVMVAFIVTVIFSPFVYSQEKILAQSVSSPALDNTAVVRELLGEVIAIQKQDIATQINGIVTSDRLAMGQELKAGDIIVSLDNREAVAQLVLAQSQYQISRTELNQQQLIFNRVAQTHAKKLSSIANYDTAQFDLQQSKNQLDVAKAKLLLAELYLEKHNIIAPFDGVLTEASPVRGKQVLPGDKLVTIINNKHLSIVTRLSPKELRQIQHHEIHLSLPLSNTVNLELQEFSPMSDPVTGLVTAQFNYVEHNIKKYGKHSEFPGQVLKLVLAQQQRVNTKQAINDNSIQKKNYVIAANNRAVSYKTLAEFLMDDDLIRLENADTSPEDKVNSIRLSR